MGCWNKTCTLSNLPILANEPVYVVMLNPSDERSRCYTTAFYRPALLPFLSYYDDYGGGYDSKGPVFDTVLEAVRKALVEKEVASPRGTRAEKAALTEETLFAWCHEGVLEVACFGRQSTAQLEFAMIRKDIVDIHRVQPILSRYVGEGKGNGGWSNSYEVFSFEEVLADVPALVTKVKEVLATPSEYADNPHLRVLVELGYGASHLCDMLEALKDNKAARYFSDSRSGMSLLVDPQFEIFMALANGDEARSIALIEAYLLGRFIDDLLDGVRKCWLPGIHEGSQESDPKPYRVMGEAINVVLEKERLRLEE